MERVKLPEPVAQIYRAVAQLEELHPGRKFTPDGHLVGSIGEAVASETQNLKLYNASTPAHDAEDALGRKVQFKMTGGRSVAMYADCERLLVLRVVSPEEAEIVYDGPGARRGGVGASGQGRQERSARHQSVAPEANSC